MNLHNFSKFSEAVKNLNEQANAYPVNEAIKSSILRDMSDLNGFRGWRNEFFKDFYRKFKVDLNEVGDNLFTTVDASTAKQMMKRKESKMIFCIFDGSVSDKTTDGRRHGVAITLNGGALYNQLASHKGRWTSRMGVDKWTRKSYMGQWDKLANFNYKHLTSICNEFIVLDVDAMQSQYSTQDIVDTRQAQKQGSAHMVSDRDVKAANKERYREILKAKVDPASIMLVAQEVAQIMFKKLADAAAGTPEEFADNFTKEHRWDSWSRNLGRILSDLGSELERYTRDYADYSTLYVENNGDMDKTKDLREQKAHWEAIQIHSLLTNSALPMANKDMELWRADGEKSDIKRFSEWSDNDGMTKLQSVAKKDRSKMKKQDEFMFFHFSHRSNFSGATFSQLGIGKVESPSKWHPFSNDFTIGVSKDLYFYF